MRNITVIHPSRGRAPQAFRTYENWVSKADNEFEYLLSIDTDFCRDYYEAFFYVDHLISICNRPNKTAIEAINEAAELATGDIFVVISDDFDCPEHWDTLLLETIGNRTHFLLKTDDSLQPTLVTLPIMDRKYYETFGYVYYPEYKHMFCDQEMTAVALMNGCYLKSNLLFKHNHYSTGAVAKDAISIKNDATWLQGERLFKERLQTNFGIPNPIIPYTVIKWR